MTNQEIRDLLIVKRDAFTAAIAALDNAMGDVTPVSAPTARKPRKTWPSKKHVKHQRPTADDSAASKRQDLLFKVIAKSNVGLTLGDLKRQTSKMDGKDRSNALQRLKAGKFIRRDGNAWVAVESSLTKS